MGNKIKNKTGEWVGDSAPRNARLCLCHLKAWKLNPHANMLNGNKGNHHQQQKKKPFITQKACLVMLQKDV